MGEVVVLAAEVDLGMHPLVFGGLAFLGLLILLAITLGIGKGRPHS